MEMQGNARGSSRKAARLRRKDEADP